MFTDIARFFFFFLSETKNNILKEDKSTKEGKDFLSNSKVSFYMHINVCVFVCNRQEAPLKFHILTSIFTNKKFYVVF